MKTKAWSEYMEGHEAEARYEIDKEGGKVIGARVIGYFTDDFGERHEFVRWDSSHGQFHKHCLYEKKQRKENIYLPEKIALNEAIRDLNENWRGYKERYLRNHVKRG